MGVRLTDGSGRLGRRLAEALGRHDQVTLPSGDPRDRAKELLHCQPRDSLDVHRRRSA